MLGGQDWRPSRQCFVRWAADRNNKDKNLHLANLTIKGLYKIKGIAYKAVRKKENAQLPRGRG